MCTFLEGEREARMTLAGLGNFFFSYKFIYFVFVAVRGLLIVVASLVAEHRL